MRSSLDCIPCFVRQALEAARFATDDTGVHELILRDLLTDIAGTDFAKSPPAVGQHIHRKLRGLTGDPDPYRVITATVLSEWLADATVPPSSRKRYYAFIRAMYAVLVDAGLAESNPATEVKPPRAAEPPVRPLSMEEVSSLLRVCGHDSAGVPNRAVFVTLFDCGLRVSELCQLTLDDIEWRQGTSSFGSPSRAGRAESRSAVAVRRLCGNTSPGGRTACRLTGSS